MNTALVKEPKKPAVAKTIVKTVARPVVAKASASPVVIQEKEGENRVVVNTMVEVEASPNTVQRKEGEKQLKQEEGRATVAVLCPKLARTCDVWALDKCIRRCSEEGGSECVTEAEFCLFAGDRLRTDVVITPSIAAEGYYYITGTVVITNPANAPGPLTFDLSTLIAGVGDIGGTFTLIRNSGANVDPIVLEPGETHYTPLLIAIPSSVNFCAEGRNEFQVQVSVEEFDTFVSEVYTLECDELVCDCRTQSFTLTDTPGNLEQVITEPGDPVVLPVRINVGREEDGRIVCNDSPIVESDTARLTPNRSVDACGPAACPVEASATITVNCVRPDVNINFNSTRAVIDKWCVCKEGEIIPPCLCPSADDVICCPKCYAQWVLTLTNTPETLEREQNVEVTVTLPEDSCLPPYGKQIYVTITPTTPGLEAVQANFELEGGATTVDAIIEINPPFPDGELLTITVGYFRTRYRVTTLGCVPQPVQIFLLLEELEVTVSDTCTAATQSVLTDTLAFQNCRVKCPNPVALPSCDDCSPCKADIADNTTITFSSTNSALPDVTFSLCDEDPDKAELLRELLERLLQDGEEVDITQILVWFLEGNFNACTPPTYDTIVLQYYTKVPKQKKAKKSTKHGCGCPSKHPCVLVNRAVVRITRLDDDSDLDSSCGTSIVTLDPADCKPCRAGRGRCAAKNKHQNQDATSSKNHFAAKQ